MRTPPRSVARLLPLLPLGALAACEAARARDDAVELASLPALALEEELRLGSLDDPDAGFSQVGPIAVDPEGNVYVAERQAREVRVFAPDGRRVGTIGRSGSGPGEFQFVAGIGFRDGHLWVSDVRNRRITLFTRGGEVVRTIPAHGVEVPLEQPGVQVRVIPSSAHPGGGWTGTLMISYMAGQEPTDSIRVPQLRFDDEGEVIDTLGYSMHSPPGQDIMLENRYLAPRRPIYGGDIRRAVGEDTIHVDRPAPTAPGPATFAVTRSRGTDTIWHHAFRYTPEPVGEAYVDSIVAAAQQRAERSSLAPGVVERAVRGGLELPAYHPPVATMRIGEDDAVWLDVRGGRWLLLTPEGEPSGLLELPPNTSARWSSGDVVWAVQRDELDVPWVVRYRVTGGE